MSIRTTILTAFLTSSLVLGASCRDKDDANDLPDAGPSDANQSEVSIQDVQDESMPEGTPVTLRGVVVIAIDTYGGDVGSIFVMEPEGGAFSGLQVRLGGTQASGLTVGDLVDIEGAVKEEFALSDDTTGRTLTQIEAPQNGSITVTKVGDGTVPDPEVVNPWDLAMDDDEAEKWEGVLITFENVSVLSAPFNVTQTDATLKEMEVTGPFRISSSLTELSDGINDGDCYASITGIGDYFFSYKVLPRSPADLSGGGTSCPAQEEGDTACDDGMDNDYDGYTDCADHSCQDFGTGLCVSDSTVVAIQDGTVSSGTAVNLNDVVVTAIDSITDVDRAHLYVADAATGAQYNGIYVYRGTDPSNFDSQIMVGSVIDVTGRVSEYNGLTEIVDPTLTFVTGGGAPMPVGVATATLADTGTDGEPYEGVLVEITDVQVQNEDAGFGKFTVTDSGGGTPLIVDDTIYQHTASANECMDSIVGVMDYSGDDDERRLLPRSAADVSVVSCP